MDARQGSPEHLVLVDFATCPRIEEFSIIRMSVLTLTMARTDDPLAGIQASASKFAPKLSTKPNHLELTLADAATALPVTEVP